MLATMYEFTVKHPSGTIEAYIIGTDEDGDTYLQNVLDVKQGGPTDMLHIDEGAFGRLAAAFTRLELDRLAKVSPVVVTFPMRKLVPGQAREERL